MRYEESVIEGRNPVREALRSDTNIDRVLLLENAQEGPLSVIAAAARKKKIPVRFLSRQRLDQISTTGKHQGVIAYTAAFAYAEVDDMLAAAREKGEPPFLFLLDGIEDPHNLGAIIRTANLCGAHGVILPKQRAAGLTAAAVRASAGAVLHTPVARVTNLSRTMENLKKEGLWFACAAADGEVMYRRDLTGPLGLVIGSEGSGVSPLVREHCDFTVSVPMYGQIDSLNASVAAGVLAYEAVRQRRAGN